MGAAIPVIDLFAGPGGLSEGFTSLGRPERAPVFDVRLSIEKDAFAHQTLQLRAFVRQFPHGHAPNEYYDALRDIERPLEQRLRHLYEIFPAQFTCAEDEAWKAELGREEPAEVHRRITRALDGARNWVLLGGPPCQAYSIAGRSRNKGKADYRPDEDKRQFLYLEYLQIIAEQEPAVFVMENVKGLLSATVSKEGIFDRILDDLRSPSEALTRENRTWRRRKEANGHTPYRVYSLVRHGLLGDLDLRDYVVRMEDYGIPQARHRVILLGVRQDIATSSPSTLRRAKQIRLRDVLAGLPRLRSGLSRGPDTDDAWFSHLLAVEGRAWLQRGANGAAETIVKTLRRLVVPRCGCGGEFVSFEPKSKFQRDWYLDKRLGGVLNHAAKAHMVSDLHRYLFVACYGAVHKKSPTLDEFPAVLRPNHANVRDALAGSNFADRFRVQLYNRAATTVTSHLAKDGHYFIHPDPKQCRSLTVREAARIQTFPDNYFFCGSRTSQYMQVGNAVPPLLAKRIASIVRTVLEGAGACD